MNLLLFPVFIFSSSNFHHSRWRVLRNCLYKKLSFATENAICLEYKILCYQKKKNKINTIAIKYGPESSRADKVSSVTQVINKNQIHSILFFAPLLQNERFCF